MLHTELAAFKQLTDLEEIEKCSHEFKRIESLMQEANDYWRASYIAALNGQQSMTLNGYTVEYKPLTRFALDTNKLSDYFHSQGYTDDEMRNIVYSHTETKPMLKLKAYK